jgi:4-hydroxybenzoate polyprenyltransferase
MNQTKLPLCVDLDGTLIRSDVLHESLLIFLKKYPWKFFFALIWLIKGGRAYLKQQLAKVALPTAALLPYNEQFIEFLKQKKAQGHPLYLATAADDKFAKAVCDHLGFFEGYFASNGKENLRAGEKAKTLVKEFGKNGFIYAGNSKDDLLVWQDSAEAYAINTPENVLKKLRTFDIKSTEFVEEKSGFKSLFRLIRPYQWVKNLLIFLPLFASHKFLDFQLFLSCFIGFCAFSLLASSTYIINDLFDLESDRLHKRKRFRPLARGTIHLPKAVFLILLLQVSFVLLGLRLNPSFLILACSYVVLNLIYSIKIKKFFLNDVFFLSAFYIIRILAGYQITGVAYSNWLIGLCLFLFLSLAFLKRFIELNGLSENALVAGRGYIKSDTPIIAMLGISCGFLTSIVLMMYIENGDIDHLYPYKSFLWFLCPLLLYMLSNLWLKANRNLLHDDPIVAVFKEKINWVFLIIAGIVISAAAGKFF